MRNKYVASLRPTRRSISSAYMKLDATFSPGLLHTPENGPHCVECFFVRLCSAIDFAKISSLRIFLRDNGAFIFDLVVVVVIYPQQLWISALLLQRAFFDCQRAAAAHDEVANVGLVRAQAACSPFYLEWCSQPRPLPPSLCQQVKNILVSRAARCCRQSVCASRGAAFPFTPPLPLQPRHPGESSS